MTSQDAWNLQRFPDDEMLGPWCLVSKILMMCLEDPRCPQVGLDTFWRVSLNPKPRWWSSSLKWQGVAWTSPRSPNAWDIWCHVTHFLLWGDVGHLSLMCWHWEIFDDLHMTLRHFLEYGALIGPYLTFWGLIELTWRMMPHFWNMYSHVWDFIAFLFCCWAMKLACNLFRVEHSKWTCL